MKLFDQNSLIKRGEGEKEVFFRLNYFYTKNETIKFNIFCREELRLKKRKEHEHFVVYPCKLRILPQNIFKTRNPIVIGVAVEAGQLRKGTPICAKTSEGVSFANLIFKTFAFSIICFSF